MVGFETAKGYDVDVSASQLGEIASTLYGYKTRVLSNVTAQTRANWMPGTGHSMLPAALKNPYFSGGDRLSYAGYNRLHRTDSSPMNREPSAAKTTGIPPTYS